MSQSTLPAWRDDAVLPLASRPLGILTALLDTPAQALGDTPVGNRKIVRVQGGHLIGPRIRATILPGGGDWALTRADGVLTLDVRLTLQTDDDALILMTYTGQRHAPPAVAAQLARGEQVSPDAMYFRVAPAFETADPRYQW